MFEILNSPKHVIAFRFKGKIDGEECNRIIEAMDSMLKSNEPHSYYIEFIDVSMTAEAILKDIQYELSIFKEWSKKMELFKRIAVVADQQWVKILFGMEATMFSIDMKLFPPSQKEEAFEWASVELSELPPSKTATAEMINKPAIHLIETTKPNTIAWEIDGYITGEDIDHVYEPFSKLLAQPEPIRMLARYKNLQGFDMKSVMKNKNIMPLKLGAIKKAERYAIVNGPSWIKQMLKIMDPFFKMQIRHFEQNEENKAWEWIYE